MAHVDRVRVLVTTSHRPTQRVRSFAKDLAAVLPQAIKINRGKATLIDLYYDAKGYGAERVVIVTVWKGNPGRIRVYKLVEPPDVGLEELVTITLKGVKLRREIPGSMKKIFTRVLGVDARNLYSEAHRMLVDSLCRAFLAKLVLSDDALEAVDTLMRVEERGGLLLLDFVSPKDGRPCGPVLRVVSVVDHVSGFRLHKGEAKVAEAGGVTG